jgi:hypothetical protein
MLFVCSKIEAYQTFRDKFREMFDVQFLDLSKVPSSQLANEAESILNHHKSCFVFLGYLEPGWMLEATHQTRLRKLFRKFPVAMVTHFVDSLPFSWKNEIDTFYTEKDLNKNGITNSLDNGSSIQNQSIV